MSATTAINIGVAVLIAGLMAVPIVLFFLQRSTSVQQLSLPTAFVGDAITMYYSVIPDSTYSITDAPLSGVTKLTDAFTSCDNDIDCLGVLFDKTNYKPIRNNTGKFTTEVGTNVYLKLSHTIKSTSS